jgi:hypothetical protein
MPFVLAGAIGTGAVVVAAWLLRMPPAAESPRRALVRLTSDVGWTDYPAISFRRTHRRVRIRPERRR